MAHPVFAILHVGSGPELTLLAYVYRVLLHLLAIGGVALVALRWPGFVDVVRSAFPPRDGSEEHDA